MKESILIVGSGTSSEDISEFGNLIAPSENNLFGIVENEVFYNGGINEIDDFLNGESFHQTNLACRVLSYENVIGILFYAIDTSMLVSAYGIPRDSIIGYEKKKGYYQFPKETNWSKIAAPLVVSAQGAAGVLIAFGAKSVIERYAQKVAKKTQEYSATEFKLKFTENNNNSGLISFYLKDHADVIEYFLDKHYKRVLSEKDKQPGNGCYIATCCYGGYESKEVLLFRKFRDSVLSKYFFGRLFIKVYYAVSPIAIDILGKKIIVVTFKKAILDKFYEHLKRNSF